MSVTNLHAAGLFDVRIIHDSEYLDPRVHVRLLTCIDNVDNYWGSVSKIISDCGHEVCIHSGFRLAPPTRNPSISLCFANSLQLALLTEPP